MSTSPKGKRTKTSPSEKAGFLLLYKPSGITSSDLVLQMKKKFSQKSVGHTGTLDRFAEGLLLLTFGPYTSFSQNFLGKDKTYYAEVFVGRKTDSGDPDGFTVEESLERSQADWAKNWSPRKLEEEMEKILSWTCQKAPKISALKVGGRRQSDLVREGISVLEKERAIRIFRVWDVVKTETGFSFRVHVSSGTYIRKLVLDLSEIWGIPLCLTRLIRESIGSLRLPEAVFPDAIQESNFRSWKDWFPLPTRTVNSEELREVLFGRYVTENLPKASEEGFFFVQEGAELPVAWCLPTEGQTKYPYRYRKVFFGPPEKIKFSQ